MPELSHCPKVGYLSAIIGSISVFSTLAVLVFYVMNKKLRGFSSRMVVYLQFSDFVLSLSIFMLSLENLEEVSADEYCVVQATLLNFGALSTVLWSSIITLIMILSLKRNIQMLKSYERYFLLIGYGVPLIMTIIPSSLQYFGPAGFWCWVETDHSYFIFIYYAILILALIYNFGGIMFVYNFLKKLERIDTVHKNSLFNKLKFYPIVLTLLWIFPIFNRMSYEIFHYKNNWTSFAHIACESFVGITNMVFYAFSPKVKVILKNKFCSTVSSERKEILMESEEIDKNVVERNSTHDISTLGINNKE